MNLLDHLYNFLVIGPAGTGKTAFMCNYMEKHYTKFGNPGYWVTFPSIVKRLNELTPDWIIPTTDPMDPAFVDHPTGRTFVNIDEIDRILSKYSHSTIPSRAFIKLLAVHRHKEFDFLASDQVFDFLKGVRTRSDWMVFTGVTDTMFEELGKKLSRNLVYWIEDNYEFLLDLSDENRHSIPGGHSTAVVTNGSSRSTFIIDFQRPEWYTLELSKIWKNVTAADLKMESVAAEEEELVPFEFDSDFQKTLFLAYHLCRVLYKSKMTKEKLAAAFIQASDVYLGEAKKLPDNGRGMPELVQATHAMGCFWCNHKSEYKLILHELKTKHVKVEEDPELDALEQEVGEVFA